MKTPYAKLAKIYAKYFGNITKVATTPIYGKNHLKNLLQNQKAGDLGTWYVAFWMLAYQVCSNYDPKLTLTYLTSRSNLLPNAYKKGAQWLSGRVLDSRPRDRKFEPHRRHCVVVLAQDTFIQA